MVSRWFAQNEIGPGATIRLDKETWIVAEACAERVFQYHISECKSNNPPASYATIRVACTGPGSSPKAHLRIYKQIPTAGIEAESPAFRRQQARAWDPPELEALRMLTRKGSKFTPRLLDSMSNRQKESDFIPDGFLVYVVWEVVPGYPLGTCVTLGENVFWGLGPDKRELIRQQFQHKYSRLCKWGVMPLHGRASHLVWEDESATLYFVGFFMANTRIKDKWSPLRWCAWGLAKRPSPSLPGPDWDGNTENWEW
ncbi:uncharacterized protein BO80DRAFT_384691 [Aspergillus ibericus CBS 121593]